MYATKERERREYQGCADFSSKMNQNKKTPLFEIGLMENDSLGFHSQGEKQDIYRVEYFNY